MMPRRDYDDRWQRFPPSQPIAVEGGIVTSHQRGKMASNWWSKHFVEVLESFGLGGRMQRGRRYARSGQVIELTIESGLLTAQVQGSRSRPYVVTVRFAELTELQWESVDDTLANRISLVASLASGEVPAELVEVFDEVGVRLLPPLWSSLKTACSCPDGAVPCKHIAAVLYVFADMLDEDPWRLLAWRGRTRDEVFDLLRARPAEQPSGDEVAPWWPFAPGPISEQVIGNAETAGSSGDADFSLRPIAPLDPSGIDVRGVLVESIITPAYELFTEADRDL